MIRAVLNEAFFLAFCGIPENFLAFAPSFSWDPRKGARPKNSPLLLFWLWFLAFGISGFFIAHQPQHRAQSPEHPSITQLWLEVTGDCQQARVRSMADRGKRRERPGLSSLRSQRRRLRHHDQTDESRSPAGTLIAAIKAVLVVVGVLGAVGAANKLYCCVHHCASSEHSLLCALLQCSGTAKRRSPCSSAVYCCMICRLLVRRSFFSSEDFYTTVRTDIQNM